MILMSSPWAVGAFDLLGLSEPFRANMRLADGAAPRLDVAWGGFHQGFGSSLAALFRRPLFAGKFHPADFFRDCWIERRVPHRAVVAAALWHIAFIVLPFPNFPARPRPAMEDTQWPLTWSGPINDLPPLNLPGPLKKPRPRGEPSKPLPPKGADAFHPRQTLINPAAPPEPPKLLPNLPNIVQLAQTIQPARPRLQISREALAKLRPRMKRKTQVTEVAAPEVSNLDPHVADVNIASSPDVPARPKLELNAGSAPRLGGPRAQRGETVAAPELAPNSGPAGSAPSMLITLSATPAPPAPVVRVPQGNLSARFSISPEGTRPGAPGGSSNGTPGATGGSGGATGSMGGTNGGAGNGIAGASTPAVSISGGNPSAASGMSGLGSGHPLIGVPRAMLGHAGLRVPTADANHESTAEIAMMHSGARPEEAFGPRRVYTLHVNMPNLNSVSGSWILNFVELPEDSNVRPVVRGELSGPFPLRKVDPKYPPVLMSEKVEGEVVLYAVIRKDGSVDSIQLIHGIDDQLDANAMGALSSWKFRPAEHQGVPVELEAIVHIPFRAVARPY